MSLVSTTTGVAVIDARTRSGTITLPVTSQIVNRYLQFKDLYGAFGRSSLTLSTQGGEAFDDGTTSKLFTDPFTFISLYAASTTRWAVLGGTQTIQQTISSLNVSSITIGSGLGWLQLPPIQTIAVSTNTLTADTIIANSTTSMYISAQILYVSSIMGAVVGAGNLTTTNLTSTVGGLGQIYLSTGGGGGLTTANLTSTVGGLGQIYLSTGGGGGLTTGNLTSTVQGLATSGYLSSISGATGFVSSLTVNSLTMGTGVGWLQLPPLQTIYSSTIYTQAQALYSLSSYFGTTSTATALQFNGLFGNYNNTVLAEVSTGAGTQEFLVFKGSSASDRIRFQTTGSFVVEPGVSARLWPTAPSNVTPAFIINTSSNVGIQTASPGATLDVAGTARAITLSSQQVFASTITVITATVSTTATISSLIVNSLQFGDGTGWINLGPTQTTVISSIQAFTNILTANTVSTLALQVSSVNGAIPLSPVNVLSTVQGLGSSGYVSTSQLFSTSFGLVDHLELTSTVAGLGTLGYVSTTQLVSTTSGSASNYSTFLSTTLATYAFPYSGQELYLNYSQTVSPYYQLGINNIIGPSFSNVTSVLKNTVDNFIVGFQSDFFLQTFITTGLWTISLFSQASGTNVSVYASLFLRNPSTTVETLIATSSSSPFIVPTSKTALTLTVDVPFTDVPVGDTLVLKIFANNSGAVDRDLTTFYENGNYSYVRTTLGTGAIQTVAFNSTIVGLGTVGYVSSATLQSSLQGLGSAGYLSTAIPYVSAFTVSTSYLTTSTLSSYAMFTYGVIGTNFFNTGPEAMNVTSLNDLNLNGGLSTILNANALYASSSNDIRFVSLSNILLDAPQVKTSSLYVYDTVCTFSMVVYGPSTLTVQGLSYFQNTVSTTSLVANQIGLIDSVTGQPSLLQSLNGSIEINGQTAVAAPELLSTVAGLGTVGYLSTAGGGGGSTTIPENLSTFAFTTSSILASTITTSSLQVDSLTIGTGTGWLNLGPLQTVAISSLQANTGALYAANTYLGIASTLTAIQFYGLTGLYQNSAVAEVATGTGTQELLLYKVSSATDRIRFQTTGSLVFEPGVSARSWPAVNSNVTPAMIINSSSNVGIQTNSPGAALDVAGTGRFITMSTLDARASSITTGIFTTNIFAVTIQSL